MKTYRINFTWTENNNAVFQRTTNDFQIRTDAKTPSDAARLFYSEWTSERNGYKITSIEQTWGEGAGKEFIPQKYAKKNWL